MSRRWLACAVVAAVVAVGCGDGDGPAADAEGAVGCPVESVGADGPVEITVWQRSDVPVPRIRELVDGFNASQDEVRVTLEVREGPWWQSAFDAIAAKRDGRALPDVLGGPGEWLPALRAADIVAPLGPCIEASGFDMSRLSPVSTEGLRAGGQLWGVPDNVLTFLLMYDRAAFVEAGLDPDQPPTTLESLRSASSALAGLGRFEAPLGVNAPVAFHHASGVAVTAGGEVVVDGPESRAVAEWLAAMGRDGMLRVPGDEPEPVYAPITTGRVAMQVVSERDVWAVADALAAGQAPEADLGVAAVPGLDGPTVPAAAFGLFLTTGSTPERRAAAWRFLEWWEAPAQQAELHLITDAFPSDPAAAAEPLVQDYWDRLPLLRQGWEALQAVPHAPVNDPVVPGQIRMLNSVLADIAYRGAAVDEALTAVAVDERRLLELGESDPVGLLTCKLELRPLPYCEQA